MKKKNCHINKIYNEEIVWQNLTSVNGKTLFKLKIYLQNINKIIRIIN